MSGYIICDCDEAVRNDTSDDPQPGFFDRNEDGETICAFCWMPGQRRSDPADSIADEMERIAPR